MRTTYKLAALALLAGGLASCKVQEVEVALPVRNDGAIVHFSVAPLETRTVFGEPSSEDGVLHYPTLWTENDTEVGISLNFASSVAAAVVPSDNFVRADFDADFSGVETDAPYTFYVLSPASALTAVSESRKALTFTVPAVQTPSANSADEAAQLLVAKSEAYEEMPENVDVHFSHLTAYGRLTLKNLPEQITVSSVSLVSSEQPWAGTWYYDTEKGTIEAKEASSSITINTDGSGDIWFACAPVDMKNKKLKISVSTDLGVYEREITLSGKNVNFSAGNVYRFSVNMSTATLIENKEVYYELVTNASSLKAGDEIIITNVLTDRVTSPYAMSTTQNTNNRGQESVIIDNNKIYNPSDQVEVFTLTAKSSSTWGLKTHDAKYLYITSGRDDNYLKSSTSANESGSEWTITIESSGVATATATISYTTKTLWYNSQNSIFSAYRKSQSSNAQMTKIRIFRKVESSSIPVSDDPILEEDTYGAYLTSGRTVYVAGSDQLSREFAEETVTFTLLSPAQNRILEFTGIPKAATLGDSFTLTLVVRRGLKVASSDDFTVTVVGEAGSKLWLTDKNGSGFIVKR